MTATFTPTIDGALAVAKSAHAAGRVDDAAAALESALRHNPHDPDGIAALANLRLEQARTTEAAKLLGIVAALTDHPQAWAEWLYYGLHDGTATPDLHRRFAARFPAATPPPRTYDGSRRLRIGYLSACHCAHVTSRFVLPLLQGHSEAAEVFGYHDGPVDATTARIKAPCAHWRNVRSLADAQVTQAIRADGIDVLVDLDGNMPGGRRQAVVAARPAPVVVGYLYPADSGHPWMHRVSDDVIDPAGGDNLVNVPGGCFAFEPREVPATPAPCERNGYVTFGSFNRVCKLSPAAARAWGEILRHVPDARLIVLAPGGEQNRSVRQLLESCGVDGGRLALRAKGDAAAFDALLAEVDVALDPWFYTGTTTTADCLCAGVPVVTLAGQSPAARVSASMLTTARLTEFIAGSEEEYVRIAVDVARSPFLSPTRNRVRGQAMVMLSDGGRVARGLEEKLIELARA